MISLLRQQLLQKFCPVLALGVLLAACAPSPEEDKTPAANSEAAADAAAYAGSSSCAGCHQSEWQDWQNSHHDLAMQTLSDESVLGDFNDSRFTHNNVNYRFFTEGDDYRIEVKEIDGSENIYPVIHVFGVSPLQQYLVQLPDDRIQAFGVAWDARPAEDGGQRWFHVYGDEYIPPDDVLHWTKQSQNWDTMCAACHSTGLEKRFDVTEGRFSTNWEEIDVACEACHGPASLHVSGAPAKDSLRVFAERQDVVWSLNEATGNSLRSEPRTSQLEIDTCGSCHARRSMFNGAPAMSENFLDDHQPTLIAPDLYHVDGQIRDEVYVYGSFLQSKMFAAGVTCSDCHNPHSLELRAPGPQVCLQCHSAETYADTSHHLHTNDSAGADCVECHMPPTDYMQVDPRHDHSMRVPRPWLSAEFGTPDACLNCHTDKDSDWSTGVLKSHGIAPDAATPHWSETLARAFSNPGGLSETDIEQLTLNSSTPTIIRASAMANSFFARHSDAQNVLEQNLSSPDAIIRLGATQGLYYVPPGLRSRLAADMLTDPVRAVRIAAVPIVSESGIDLLSGPQARAYRAALTEYIDVQNANTERAESHVNLGTLEMRTGNVIKAEEEYLLAYRLNPDFIPVYINLADLYRATGRDIEGEVILRAAIGNQPGYGALHYTLGLNLVRQQRLLDAVPELGIAADAPDATPGFALAYALALDAAGETAAAVESLNRALERFGEIPELMQARTELQNKL